MELSVIISEAQEKGLYGQDDNFDKPTFDAWKAAVSETSKIGRTRSVLANAVVSDFQDKASTVLVGKKIKTSGDLATLAQVYRNPKYETFHYFFTRGDEIVGKVGVSSRMPVSVSAERIEGVERDCRGDIGTGHGVSVSAERIEGVELNGWLMFAQVTQCFSIR